MASVLCLYGGWYWVASKVPSATMGWLCVHDLLAVKFIWCLVMALTQGSHAGGQRTKACGAVGGVCVCTRFYCGFIGAGGGMMMLLILTSAPGYELKLPWAPARSS